MLSRIVEYIFYDIYMSVYLQGSNSDYAEYLEYPAILDPFCLLVDLHKCVISCYFCNIFLGRTFCIIFY